MEWMDQPPTQKKGADSYSEIRHLRKFGSIKARHVTSCFRSLLSWVRGLENAIERQFDTVALQKVERFEMEPVQQDPSSPPTSGSQSSLPAPLYPPATQHNVRILSSLSTVSSAKSASPSDLPPLFSFNLPHCHG